jgi:hypothetical protein
MHSSAYTRVRLVCGVVRQSRRGADRQANDPGEADRSRGLVPTRRTDEGARRPRGLVRHRQPASVRRGRAAARGGPCPADRRCARRVGGDLRPGRPEARGHDLRVDPRALPGGDGLTELRRRHRLDAHVLAGQDVDRWAHCAAEAPPPSPHPVQPRSPLGGDRHGLHEPQSVGPWRPRVRVSRDSAPAQPGHGRRPLAGSRRPRPHRHLGSGRLRLAGAPPAQARPLVETVRTAPEEAVDHVVEDYESRYTLAPTLRAGGEHRAALCEAARIEVGLRTFLETRSRISATWRNCRASQSSG